MEGVRIIVHAMDADHDEFWSLDTLRWPDREAQPRTIVSDEHMIVGIKARRDWC